MRAHRSRAVRLSCAALALAAGVAAAAPARAVCTAADVIAAGDVAALVDEAGDRHLVRVPAGDAAALERVRGLGVFGLSKLAGLRWASRLAHGNKSSLLLPPGTTDLVRGLARKAQIVLPKDAARIVLECGTRAGSAVVEAGIGSGALTTVLARAVAPTSRVITFEVREDFAAWGIDNLRRAGVDHLVDVRIGDATQGFPAIVSADAVVLDVPDPWNAVEHAKRALRPGGFFAAYSPLVSQLEATQVALGRAGSAEVRSLELIEREWIVGERGSRPSFEMLGHTAFLTFARRVA